MEKLCAVCGKPLIKQQIKYCSKKCMGLGKQGYKICPVCGKTFPEWERSTKICCSPECSKKYRSEQHKEGKYDDSIVRMRQGFQDKVNAMDPEEMWTAKGWVIQSPNGQVYECRNLMHFIRENPDLFDGTPKQAFDGFAKIKASYQGKRKNPCYSWKGWKLLSYSD